MQKFSGIDLHSDNSMVVVSDEEDRIVYQRRLPNDLAGIVQALAPFQKELIGVVVEATYNWYWLVDGLMDAGYRVHLAITAAIKIFSGVVAATRADRECSRQPLDPDGCLVRFRSQPAS